MSSVLTISRSDRGYPDRYGAYKVVLDEQVVGRIKRGESLTIETDPGDHQLHFRIAWCRSVELQVHLNEGQVRTVNCRPNSNAFLWFFWYTVGFKRYIRAELLP